MILKFNIYVYFSFRVGDSHQLHPFPPFIPVISRPFFSPTLYCNCLFFFSFISVHRHTPHIHTHLLPLSPNHPWCDLRLHRSSAHWSSWDSGIVLGQCTEAQRAVVRELVLQHLGLDIPTPKASIAKLFNHRTVSASLCHGSAFLSHKFLAPESKAKS